MRTTQQIIYNYFSLLNEEHKWGYDEDKKQSVINTPVELGAFKERLVKELYSTELHKCQTINTIRAFQIWCDVIVNEDIKTGRKVWITFVKQQFDLVEKNKYSCYMAHRGCFTGDTVVFDREGHAKQIKEMHNSWSTGIKKVYRVYLNNGRNVKCTINHPFYTDKGFKVLKDIDIKNDKVALLSSFNVGKEDNTSSDFAKLLGYLNTDGYLNNAIKKKQSIKFTNTNAKMLEEVRCLVKRLFPKINIKEYPKGNALDLLLTVRDCKNPLRKVIKEMDYDSNFPRDVFSWSNENIIHFLNRVYSCDGSIINVTQKNGSITSEINLTTGINETYAKYLQMLLLRVGIQANLIIHYCKKYQTQYDLRIYSRPIIKRFFETIGIIYGKEEQSEEAYRRSQIKPHKFYSYKEPKRFRPSDIDSKLVDDGEEVFWGKILKIEYLYEDEVYDMELEGKEWFIADGVMVHNSGKSYFFSLYASFKMWLLPYLDICYCTNVTKQRNRWFGTTEDIIDNNEFLLEKKDHKAVANRKVPWGQKDMGYNNANIEGTTLGTTPRGGHFNLVIGDDPLRDDQKYTYESILNYFLAVLRPTTYTKKARYIISGCVVADTKIVTEEGLMEIGDVIDYDKDKKGYSPLDIEVYGKEGMDNTSSFYVNGFSKTKKITLQCGYEIECTLEHPLWTCTSPRKNKRDIIKQDIDWTRANNLRIGDKIALKVGTNKFGKKETINEDLAYLYGLYTAEGSRDEYRITISNKDPYCVNFIKSKFNFISRDECHHRKSSKDLVKDMEEYGVSFTTCHYKRVPKKLMKEPKHIQVAFLQGLYDGDGHSNISNKHLRVVLNSTSKKQLQDVQQMLLNFGILSTLGDAYHKSHYKKDGSFIRDSHCHTLTCSGQSGIKFLEDIGFRIDYKNKDVSKVIHINNTREHFGFVWKKIKSIKDSENHTFDFVIPKNHSFVSNGIVSHNTPQDIDDLFHTLMNSKLDKSRHPIGEMVLEQISSSGFYSAIFPSILDEIKKTILVPEIWTYDLLMKEKGEVGEFYFNREMMCRCITHRNSLIGAALFRKCRDDTLQFIQKGEKGKKYMIVVDSATSDAPTADYCAMTVFEDGERFIPRHLVHEKGFPLTDPEGGINDQPHKLLELYNDFNKPLIVVEKNNAGVGLIQGVKALAAKKGIELDIIEHYTHDTATGRSTKGRGKVDDIMDYVVALKSGEIAFPSDPNDIYTLDAIDKIKGEHLNFGSKKGKSGEVFQALAGKDDIFDTCYIGNIYRGDSAETLPYAITVPGNG